MRCMHWDVGNNSKFACGFRSANQMNLSSIYTTQTGVLLRMDGKWVTRKERGGGIVNLYRIPVFILSGPVTATCVLTLPAPWCIRL